MIFSLTPRPNPIQTNFIPVDGQCQGLPPAQDSPALAVTRRIQDKINALLTKHPLHRLVLGLFTQTKTIYSRVKNGYSQLNVFNSVYLFKSTHPIQDSAQPGKRVGGSNPPEGIEAERPAFKTFFLVIYIYEVSGRNEGDRRRLRDTVEQFRNTTAGVNGLVWRVHDFPPDLLDLLRVQLTRQKMAGAALKLDAAAQATSTRQHSFNSDPEASAFEVPSGGPWQVIAWLHGLCPEPLAGTCTRRGCCGRAGVSTCSACKKFVYCGPECQRLDWKEQKNLCNLATTSLMLAAYVHILPSSPALFVDNPPAHIVRNAVRVPNHILVSIDFKAHATHGSFNSPRDAQ
ncbi:hypothetical protein C8R43DRAFT_942681 [Mycena crocata]|nr:hypothetical protein C8R43DRAFT_942681 [Mycena crocata]